MLEAGPKRWFDWSEIREMKLQLRPDVRLEETSFIDQAACRAGVRILDAPGPFAFRTDCPEWAAEALPLLNGSRTVNEVVPESVDGEEAEAFFGCLLDAGVMRPN